MANSIVSKIKMSAKAGTRIPKPESENAFVVKGWGTRRSEPALIYYIPNHQNPSRPHQKGITESEFEKACRQVLKSGELTSKWFNENLAECATEGSCNFTTLGGIFELIGLVEHAERGRYRVVSEE